MESLPLRPHHAGGRSCINYGLVGWHRCPSSRSSNRPGEGERRVRPPPRQAASKRPGHLCYPSDRVRLKAAAVDQVFFTILKPVFLRWRDSPLLMRVSRVRRICWRDPLRKRTLSQSDNRHPHFLSLTTQRLARDRLSRNLQRGPFDADQSGRRNLGESIMGACLVRNRARHRSIWGGEISCITAFIPAIQMSPSRGREVD